LIIYDEVHLLPAQVFKETASLQAKRRLGMTATFIREDGKEKEIFTLIGPKRYESPWKEIEGKGWIAEAECYEIRVPLEKSLRNEYIKADKKEKYKIASQNPLKYEVVKEIVKKHKDEKSLL
jgi:DNA or RNA helicases of superfamily II